MKTKEQAVQEIREKIERIEETRRVRDSLPPECRVTFGRHTGQFMGGYPDHLAPGGIRWVFGDTQEEVEAEIANKLELLP